MFNMKYAFYTKKNNDKIHEMLDKIKSTLDKDFIEDIVNPEIVFTIGGDGTLLEAIHHYIDKIDDIVFFPFMMGHIGFYIDFFPEDIDKINEIVKNKNIRKIPMLEALIKDETYYAVNEFSLGQFAHASAYDIYVDDNLLESYYGSGILFSTTYGSSAYNRSVGGPLVDIDLNAFVMSKIAPITSRQYSSIAAPIVFSPNKIITLKYNNRRHQTLTMDNQIQKFDDLETVIIKLSKRTVSIYTREKFAHLQRIRKAC